MTTANPVFYASQTSDSEAVQPSDAEGARCMGVDASLVSFIVRAVLAVGLLGFLIIH
jgi:hypothetical protein